MAAAKEKRWGEREGGLDPRMLHAYAPIKVHKKVLVIKEKLTTFSIDTLKRHGEMQSHYERNSWLLHNVGIQINVIS